MSTIRYHLKLCHVIVHIIYGCLICLLFFPFLKKASKHKHIQRWSQRALAIFNVRVKTDLSTITSDAVVISNHTSWLDIFVINSLMPCRFVAKADIRSWPLLGWLAQQGGTIYISRGTKADVKRIYQHLIERIKAGDRVAFFPEGTVAAPGEVLPFHANLFEAAIHANVPIQPLALRYVDPAGDLHQAIYYADDVDFFTSMKSVLNEVLNGGEIIVELNGLKFIPSEGVHRRDLAALSRKAVASALRVEID